MVTLTMTLGDP